MENPISQRKYQVELAQCLESIASDDILDGERNRIVRSAKRGENVIHIGYTFQKMSTSRII